MVFIWKAWADLLGRAASVELIITPISGAKDGEPFRSQPLRAGNTQPSVRDPQPSSSGERIELRFLLFDGDARFGGGIDRGQLASLSVEADGVEVAVPLDKVDPQDFPSRADDVGERVTFGFKATDVGQSPLAMPGFAGDLTLRFLVVDFPREGQESLPPTEVTFRFDNNEPPFVEVLPPEPGDLESGIILIRYRVFDAERNPCEIEFTVDFLDGKDPRVPNELPAPPSAGRRLDDGAKILAPADFGDPGKPYHTYLWDAWSQQPTPDRLVLRVQAKDRENGLVSS